MKIINLISPQNIFKLLSYWPPYLAAGISVAAADKDVLSVRVQMKQRFYNTNYVGSHFGGSLYSMCDPHYMFLLLHHLKEDHIVWDKAASIEFIKPGKGTVFGDFTITLEDVKNIKQQALQNFKVEPTFSTTIFDQNQQPVALVKKVLYVRRKDAKERFKAEKTISA